MATFRAEKGLLVGWGGFKKPVTESARNRYFDIRLWTADRLIEEIQRHYEDFPDALKAELPMKRVWTIVSGEE